MPSLKKSTQITFLSMGSVVLISFVTVTLYWSGRHFRESMEWSNHSREVLLKLNKFAARMEAAETSQRGYILTGQSEFLKPYLEMESNIIHGADELLKMVSDNPEQMSRVQTIKKVAQQKLLHIDRLIAMVQEGKTQAALALVRNGDGQQIMNQFREAVAVFEQKESEILRIRFQAGEEYFQHVTLLIVLSILSAVGFGLAVISLLQKEVVEKEKAQNELEIAKSRALELSDLKSKFLANMSHEIRTPLNGIIGMSQLVLKTPLDQDQFGYVEVIRDASQSLLVLINEILDLSKIESGKLELEEVNFELRSLIQSVIAILKITAQSKGLEIKVEIDSNIPDHFSGDSLRIRQVLINLMGNAIKFSHRSPVVLRVALVNVLDSRAQVHFEVEDNGIGIEPSVQPKLFNQFTQGDQSTTRKYGGTGLGLSISKQLVELMGGQMGLKSEVNVGSVFSFDIPLRIVNFQPKEPQHKMTQVHDRPKREGRILVVEDNLINQKVIQGMLQELGFAYVLAENGQKALEVLKSSYFDLVIMDGHMPIMDGYEATQRIRQGETGPKNEAIPIIAATANAVKGDLERCLEAGMNDYLSKPLLLQDIEIKIKKWIAHRGTFLNTNVLQNLKGLDANGSNSLLLDIIGIFESSVPESIDKMRRLYAERDFEGLRNEAHCLKSSCGNVGATTMYDLCYRLEKIKVSDEEQINSLLEVMEKNFKMTAKELKRYASN